MLWKSLSERACRRFLGFSSMALRKVVQALLRVARDAVEHRQAVVGIIGVADVADDAVELLARLFVVALFSCEMA